MIDGGLAALLREHLPSVHWQRIETGGTGRGIPDINGCYLAREFWCELKATDGWAVTIRPEQIGWSERRTRAGGRVLLLTRRQTTPGPRKGAAVDQLWVHRAQDMRHVSALGLQAGPEPLLMAEGGPSQWPWAAVLALMMDRHP